MRKGRGRPEKRKRRDARVERRSVAERSHVEGPARAARSRTKREQADMSKVNVKVDALKKVISRLVKAAPARKSEPVDALARLIRAFLEYDCDEARTAAAERKILDNMVD